MHVILDAIGIRDGGAAEIVRELSPALAAARPNWRFTLFLFPRAWRKFDDPSPSDNLSVEHVAAGNWAVGRWRWLNRSLQRKAAASDVVFHLANIGASRPKKPQVIYVQQMKAIQNNVPPDLRLRILRYWIRRTARTSDAIIVQSDHMKHLLADLEKSLDCKTHVIPAGVRKSEPAAEAPALNASRPWLFYPSLARQHKNHAALLAALPLIRLTVPTATLLLTIPQQKIDGAICLGTLKPAHVDALLRQCDAMVFPSLAESFGLPLVEALAAGCRIAAADLPYVHEICGDAAVYFDPHDPADIANAVLNALKNDRLRPAAAARAARFDYKDIAERIAEVLAKVANVD